MQSFAMIDDTLMVKAEKLVEQFHTDAERAIVNQRITNEMMPIVSSSSYRRSYVGCTHDNCTRSATHYCTSTSCGDLCEMHDASLHILFCTHVRCPIDSKVDAIQMDKIYRYNAECQSSIASLKTRLNGRLAERRRIVKLIQGMPTDADIDVMVAQRTSEMNDACALIDKDAFELKSTLLKEFNVVKSFVASRRGWYKDYIASTKSEEANVSELMALSDSDSIVRCLEINGALNTISMPTYIDFNSTLPKHAIFKLVRFDQPTLVDQMFGRPDGSQLKHYLEHAGAIDMVTYIHHHYHV